MTITQDPALERLSAFVAGLDQLSPALRERAATCLLYNVGISYGMADTSSCLAAEEAVLEIYGEPVSGGATLLVSGRKSSLAGAAFANAVVFGASGRADTIGTIHASNAMLSAIVALAEARGLGADAILPALVVGYEIGARVDLAYAEEAARNGFRSTAVFGAIAAAAACARLIGLDAPKSLSAMALAAGMAGGVLQPFADGSEDPRYQPGHAAVLGLNSAILAERGTRGGRRAMDGASGLVRAVTGRSAREGELDQGLGQNWLIDEVTFKPFPVCYFAQTSVYAGVAAHAKITGSAIRSVLIRLNPRAAGYAGLDFTGPFKSKVEVMMSAAFAVVHGLVTGLPVTMPDVLALGENPSVKSLLANTRLIGDPEVSLLSAVLDIELADGRTVTHEQFMTERDFIFSRSEVISMATNTIAGMSDVPSSQKKFDVFSESIDQIEPADIIKFFQQAFE